IGAVSPKTPAPLRWIVERCHAKEPERRYASTRDLARDLATLRDHLSETSTAFTAAASPPRTRSRAVVLAAAFALAIAATAFVTRRLSVSVPPVFRQLTFRRGYVASARFAPDGRSVLYGAAWDGAPVRLHQARVESPESAPLDLPNANLLAVSP